MCVCVCVWVRVRVCRYEFGRCVADQDPLSPSAVVPGYEYGEDCDGSLSFVDGEPIITFGPGCDPPRFGDAPVVALARPKVMMIITC